MISDFLKYLKGLEPESQHTENEHIHCYTFIDFEGYKFYLSVCHYDTDFIKLEVSAAKGPIATLIDRQVVSSANDIADTLKKCMMFKEAFPQCCI